MFRSNFELKAMTLDGFKIRIHTAKRTRKRLELLDKNSCDAVRDVSSVVRPSAEAASGYYSSTETLLQKEGDSLQHSADSDLYQGLLCTSMIGLTTMSICFIIACVLAHQGLGLQVSYLRC